MPVYEYAALDGRGRTRKGIIDADGESVARSRIRALGLYPVEVRETSVRRRTEGGRSGASVFRRVGPGRIAGVTRQLATLLGAGIPLDQSLASLVLQTQDVVLKRALAEIKASVNEGSSLADALGFHPALFSNVYVNMVRAGEASGALAVVLARLADFGERQEALRGRLQAALLYPAFMSVTGIGILGFLIVYIVPGITKVFSEMKHALPLPTLFLINLSAILKVYWWLIILLAAAGIIALRLVIRTGSGRFRWDLLKLRMPITGAVIRKILLARFAGTMAGLLESGVGLIPSLQIVSTLIDNVQIGKVIDAAVEQIRQGRSMTHALGSSEWFPPMFIQMLAVGEQSGRLGAMLKKVAEAYEREVETSVLGITSLIEPLMIVVMGAGVGFVVLSILLPIFEMNQLIR